MASQRTSVSKTKLPRKVRRSHAALIDVLPLYNISLGPLDHKILRPHLKLIRTGHKFASNIRACPLRAEFIPSERDIFNNGSRQNRSMKIIKLMVGVKKGLVAKSWRKRNIFFSLLKRMAKSSA